MFFDTNIYKPLTAEVDNFVGERVKKEGIKKRILWSPLLIKNSVPAQETRKGTLPLGTLTRKVQRGPPNSLAQFLGAGALGSLLKSLFSSLEKHYRSDY
jgi:hypothetical protein